jgi:hypothetical protein
MAASQYWGCGNIKFGLKWIAGPPWLYIPVTVVRRGKIITAMGVFVDELFVPGNAKSAINEVRERMNNISKFPSNSLFVNSE